jgi:hypothetical protein
MRGALLALALHSCASTGEGAEPRPRFVFQSHFWVNLHHFLRAEARRRERGAELVQPLAELGPEEREAWKRALDGYRGLARRSLLFDEGMVQIHVALSAADPEGRSTPLLDDAELGAALEDAAPVFRTHRWAARARTNDEWIQRTRPVVERIARQVTDELAAAHQLAWPSEPVLVDVTSETGPTLAYTTSDAPPGFAGLATIDPSVPGGSTAAVETVFHEAAHVLDATLVRWVEEESARQGVGLPADLWHAILFYTAGVLSARALGEAGTYREDLARIFPAFLPGLDEFWKPYLDGKLPLTEALSGLVRAAAVAQ